MAPRGTYQHDCAPRSQGIGPATFEGAGRGIRALMNTRVPCFLPHPGQLGLKCHNGTQSHYFHLCPSGSAPVKAP